ncbi:ethanolamine ammonia-lyase subunit EutC [Yersinia bercovieri]|uniref:Ethanolamine ammonia-lyase small subunit n=1 Tax=Yersinia bercovieri TaxID=634 RepID=A0A2G4U642_YERBE|nr:ethanolamine ammonia-lyase subunit EutC [Yersinia bercovieri]MDN0101444.1 ethanolamine ammonia-lyase subunit EutC [Yersinia bercovieri]PHZ28801.1 ethanolamine ammonia-lyase subunit EutC [Yersinia bercovieri]QKJ05968.1 ethanolamine ammonia-lyase subunit EutC [Yersinia bercovieri ATCC 43970]CFQ41428.1 Ethanolamine ammonia-lyase light chain [Yersinia bercovieri]CNI55809.1 Ethanolamine ammonia-lyase light chain [Yersinia bercovieri]
MSRREIDLLHHNPWQALRQFTAARIALGRSGASLPTAELLKFGLAHAQACDAVHQPFLSEELASQLAELGLRTITANSAAPDRLTYLRRPDLGRKLSPQSHDQLCAWPDKQADLLLVIGDGLSSKAVHRQAVPLIVALLPYLHTLGLSLAPIVLAHQSRVALGDDAGECLQAKVVVMLIGERPGLSSPDSLGVYMTWGPNIRRLESERNCISNIRPEGLDYPQAAFKLAWLLEHSFQRRLSGVQLKDESDNPALHGQVSPAYVIDGMNGMSN